MAWWGKVVGGAFGFLLGGPLGALLGATLGHRFDGGGRRAAAGDQERIQAAFFTASFAVMGHIAKADGRVSRDEIELANRLMAGMNLDDAQRDLAQSLFNQGKQPNFDLAAVLSQFRNECHRRDNLIRMFMEIQIQAALADGRIAAAENAVLRQVAEMLGIAQHELDGLIDFIRGAHGHDYAHQNGRGHAHGHAHGNGQGRHGHAAQTELADAYRVLGVTADTPLGEVRKAYRRLLGRHHPDKLVAKGLPPEMIKLANQKTHEIRKAWEVVKVRAH